MNEDDYMEAETSEQDENPHWGPHRGIWCGKDLNPENSSKKAEEN